MSKLDINKPHPFPDDFTALDLCIERVRAYLADIYSMQPVVEAACEFVDLQQAMHHGPVKNETKIKVRAALYQAVIDYQENQQ